MPATVIDPRAITAPPSRRGTFALLSIAPLIALAWTLPLLLTGAIMQGKKVLTIR
jgi:hypothetical protein